MGMFYCHGCNDYRDSKECEQYIHTNDAEYCSDECAPISVAYADVLKNLSTIGKHPALNEGVAV